MGRTRAATPEWGTSMRDGRSADGEAELGSLRTKPPLYSSAFTLQVGSRATARRVIVRALPVLLLTALLVAVAAQPELRVVFTDQRDAPAPSRSSATCPGR